MATIAAVEKQIAEREGFRVQLAPLTPKVKSLPDYDYTVMAPQRWKISDWKNERLARYVELLRSVTVFRGDGEPVPRDLQLGNLRDTYYEAAYGKPPVEPRENVVNFRSRDAKAKKRPSRRP
jgi:hypothetical protein